MDQSINLKEARNNSGGEAMKFPRRKFLHLAAAAAALPAVPRIASARSYPARPVHFIVMYPAGSAPDIIARLAGQWLSDRLGQQFIIENRPGFGGNIATEFVAKSGLYLPRHVRCDGCGERANWRD